MLEREIIGSQFCIYADGSRSVATYYSDGSAEELPVASISYDLRADTVDIEAGDQDTEVWMEDADGEEFLFGKRYLEIPYGLEIAALLTGHFVPLRTLCVDRLGENN